MARPLLGLMLLTLATPGVAGEPGPFESLGLVRFESGIRAPEFTLPGLDGRSVGVPARTGTAAVLVFWATW
ncbi:MAG: hypothetical protein HY002_01870 [Candidatus Rokubacteria bacterium]|nr:hypothetical protein [Candidatus Rokubacteria bacterium]